MEVIVISRIRGEALSRGKALVKAAGGGGWGEGADFNLNYKSCGVYERNGVNNSHQEQFIFSHI